MINCTRYALALAITLCALVVSTHAQTLPGDAVAQASAAAPQSPTAVGTITGEGTAGKIAKFDGTNSITNSSVLTESAGKLLVNGSLEVGAASGVGVNPTIVNPKNLANSALVRFYPAAGTNVNTSLSVVPRGTGQPNNRAQFSVTNTDAIADPSNVEFAALRARGSDFVFGTGKSGTGTIRPLMFSAGYLTDNATNANQLVLATSGNVGIGTALPSAKLQVVTDGHAIRGEANTGGDGVSGISKTTGRGVYGESGTGTGVWGINKSTSLSDQTAGVVGINTSGGWSGFFFGPVKVVGGCDGCTTAPSDRTLKANITAVDPRSVLDKLAALPIREWNYKSDSPSVRHVGPIAQDFRAAFQLGADDKHIDLIDANGVTMASIQALYQMMLEKDKQNQELNRKVERLQAQLNQVRRTIRGKRARVRAR